MNVLEKNPEVATEAEAAAVEAPRADSPDFYALMVEAVKEPGHLAEAHKFFHKYSLQNCWLAATQLRARGEPLQPINTFKGWLALERPVQKGQKASISMVRPVPVGGKKKKDEEEDAAAKAKAFTRFLLSRSWFSLSQTDGKPFDAESVSRGEWKLSAVLDMLNVTEVPYEFSGVNDVERMGWASQESISVSPLAPHQEFSRIRELARVALHHFNPDKAKSIPETPELRDLEAEATAYLVAATFGFDGMEAARVRIQDHLAGGPRMRMPDRLAQRAFAAADKLINHGYC